MTLNIANYKVVMQLFESYEKLNLYTYTGNNPEKFIVTDEEFRKTSSVDELMKKYQNPFHQLYFWLKGEIQDIEELAQRVANRDSFDLSKTKAQEGLEIDADAQKENQAIYPELLKKLILIHLARDVIPAFKKEKLRIYH